MLIKNQEIINERIEKQEGTMREYGLFFYTLCGCIFNYILYCLEIQSFEVTLLASIFFIGTSLIIKKGGGA